MRIPGRKGLRMGTRWLRSRLRGGALILGYHQISDSSSDYYSLCVKPRHFSEHLAVLRDLAIPMSLRHLVQGLEDGSVPRGAVVVTFDDGYADNLHNAKPLLEQYGVPATIFVATAYLGRTFWWDELAALILPELPLGTEMALVLSNGTFNWKIDEDDSREQRWPLLRALYQALRPLTEHERRSAIDDLRESVSVVRSDWDRVRALTPTELVTLANDDLIDIGSHSHTHPLLASLAKSAQEFEIRHSKSKLQELIGTPVVGLSYPHGSHSQTTRRLVRESGYEFACQSNVDVAWRATQRFELPRFWVPDCDGEAFSRWLNRWLTA